MIMPFFNHLQVKLAIDATHIDICRPKERDVQRAYKDGKTGGHTIKVEGVCDARGQLRHVSARSSTFFLGLRPPNLTLFVGIESSRFFRIRRVFAASDPLRPKETISKSVAAPSEIRRPRRQSYPHSPRLVAASSGRTRTSDGV
jgi:hypothetical protein